MSTQLMFWLGVLVVSIVFEIATMGLTSIWFAGGALVAAVIAWLGGNIWFQIFAFILVSIALLAFTRPVAVKYFNKQRFQSNVDGLVGQKAVVTKKIDNLKGIGQVAVSGQEWTARSATENRVIPEGTIVCIREVSGVKLIVEIDESVAAHVPELRSEAELDPNVFEDETESE